MEEKDIAYVAGIIDGEGSICLTSRNKNKLPSPCVSVSSTDPELLFWIKSKFGGKILGRTSRETHHKQAYVWTIFNRKALSFLRLIRPYLVIERRKLRTDLLINEYLLYTPRNGKYTKEMLLLKKEFIKRFHEK
jgi:hypothetical protein